MATTQEKATPRDAVSAESSALLRKAGEPVRDWTGSASDLDSDPIRTRASVPTLIRPMESLPAPSTNTAATKGAQKFTVLFTIYCLYLLIVILTL